MAVALFWDLLGGFGDKVALIDGGLRLTYAELDRAVGKHADAVASGTKKLAFLVLERNINGLVCYLSLLRAGHAVCLCDEGIDPIGLQELVLRFRPDFILWQGRRLDGARGYRNAEMHCGHSMAVCENMLEAPAKELALLLATSGTTGNAKFVRLSWNNIAAAALQVRDALEITPDDRAITAFALSHVYGLSVVHSHLAAGASLVLNQRPLSSPAFWKTMQKTEVTSLAGVTWTFAFMRDLGVCRDSLPHLRKMMHSTGAMDPVLGDWMMDEFAKNGVQIFFMYGQTEATGRMCVLPPGLAEKKRGFVGKPVPDGYLGQTQGGEIIFYGPNVMLGYAKNRDDLGRGDELMGMLHTGDLGLIDSQGHLRLSGRTKRICKILGQRINLDEVQEHFVPLGVSASSSDDSALRIFFDAGAEKEIARRADRLAKSLRIPRHAIHLEKVTNLPRSDLGKIRHDALQATRQK